MLVPGLNTHHHAFFPWCRRAKYDPYPEWTKDARPNLQKPNLHQNVKKKLYELRPSESWFPSDGALTINLSKPSGFFTYHQV
jgi:hypothetical protein